MKKQTILAGAGIMAVAALLSRVLGWVRDHEIGRYWGSTLHTDAYWAAYMVPDFLYFLLAGGALGAAIIPTFSAYLRRHEEEESWQVANTLVTFLGLCALAGIALIIVFAPGLVTLAAAGFRKDVGKANEAIIYARLLAPMVLFTVLSALFTGILQAHRHYTAPAFAWLVYNVGIIAGAVVGGRYFISRGDVAGLRVLCMGVVVGAALLVLVQIPALLARGFRFRPNLDLSRPGVREVLRLFLPYMAGLAFTQICLLWLPSFFGSFFPSGVTSLRYANRLVVLPLGVFGIAISTAAFPAMAEHIAAGEAAAFRKLFSGALRATLFLSVPCAAVLVVLAGPILRLLWQTGRFKEAAVSAATFCLVYYAVSLIGLAGLQVVNRAFYSLKDTRTPPLVGIGYTTLIVILAFGLKSSGLQYASIAAATSVGVTVGMLIMFEVLRRRLGGIDGRAIAVSFLRVLFASLVMAAVSFFVAQYVGRGLGVPVTRFASRAPMVEVVRDAQAPGTADGARSATPHQTFSLTKVAVQVVASLLAGFAVYLLVLRLLGAPEIHSVRETLRRRRTSPRD